jgi:Tfp pilus assembly protein PilV
MKMIMQRTFRPPKNRQRGFLMVDAAVAVVILLMAIMPLAYSFAKEARLLRAAEHRAVAMEIVDGEMEILAAGEWRNFPDGTQDYPVRARAAATLPAGKFQLTKNGNHLRLEWTSDLRQGIGPVIREATIK